MCLCQKAVLTMCRSHCCSFPDPKSPNGSILPLPETSESRQVKDGKISLFKYFKKLHILSSTFFLGGGISSRIGFSCRFSHSNNSYRFNSNNKNEKAYLDRCARNSNPGPQDGRRKRHHGSMCGPQNTHRLLLSNFDVMATRSCR